MPKRIENCKGDHCCRQCGFCLVCGFCICNRTGQTADGQTFKVELVGDQHWIIWILVAGFWAFHREVFKSYRAIGAIMDLVGGEG